MDLREAYERGRALASTYGDLVDAWEFENEPDIAFFADNADVFAAFHKAVALGLAEGRRARGARMTNDQCPMTQAAPAWAVGLGESVEAGFIRDYPRNPRLRFAAGSAGPGPVAPPERSLVLMAAPGLPPGPHFEQLLANGYLSYTEGFNYHHYGFAMDYAGVYSQFHNAVTEDRGQRSEAGAELRSDGGTEAGCRGPEAKWWIALTPTRWFGQGDTNGQRVEVNAFHPVKRRLPIFLTEWGYSLLDGHDAQTVEGRVRQWRYFADVARQNERLRVAAPMAFLLRPYFEIKAKEFGLSMPADEVRAAHYGFTLGEEGEGPESRINHEKHERHEKGAKPGGDVPEFRAGGLTFTPEDFGADEVEPWMERIGERVGDAEASPALAWLLDNAGRRSRAGGFGLWSKRARRDWVVRTERPSPVVMDFLAGPDVRAVKSDHGYWLWGEVSARATSEASMSREGSGAMVFYNFGAMSAEVRPVWPEWIRPVEDVAVLTLAPGERREVPVSLRARADRLLPVDARIAAEVKCAGARTESRWASRFYALPNGAVTHEVGRFDFSAEAAEGNRARLLARPRAPEEPALRRDGRWLVTEGTRVEETDWGWRLHVDHFPGVALRPAVAELPLPEGWVMREGMMLSYDYRIIDAEGAVELTASSPDARLRRQTGIAGNLAESYIRTATGNLFGTVPRLSPKPDWRSYRQGAETFTMHFLGRTVPPWRFAEHKPAALVFFVRPTRLPAIFEVRNPRLIEVNAGW